MVGRLILLVVPAALLTPQAGAQDTRTAVDQIGTGPAGPVQQISTGSRQIPATVPLSPPTTASSPQLSSNSERAPPSPQLTSELRGVRGAAQLYTGGPTAQPPEPLSRLSEGRVATVAPVSGNDRCDPAAASDPRIAKVCAAVIENRAAEFKSPEPPELSPEQRLAIEQRARNASATRDASRRLADVGLDPGSIEAQGVASFVFGDLNLSSRNPEPLAEGIQGLSEGTAAIVNAIVAGAGGQAPPR